MTIATIDTRRADDYHDIEDPLEYITESGRADGSWLGQGARLAGLSEMGVNVQDFARKSFGFEPRPSCPGDGDTGVTPELERWALARIKLWRAERVAVRLAQIDRRRAALLLNAKTNPSLPGLTKRQSAARRRVLERGLAELDEEAERVRKADPGAKGLAALKRAERAAAKAALAVETPRMKNADPAGLALALFKTRISKLENQASASGDPAERADLSARIGALRERAAPFLEQAKEVERLRASAERLRDEHKQQKKIGAARLEASGREADPSKAELLAGEASAALDDSEAALGEATEIEQALKTTPGAFSQGISLTLSFHKSISLAMASADEPVRERLAEILERTNREWIESVGRKYARTRTAPLGPDGKPVVEYHRVRGLTSASFFHMDARPDEEGGIAKPSAHWHNEIMRDVETLDGRVLALDTDYIRQNLKAAGAEAAALLARNLRDAGFKPECYKSPKGEEFVGLAGFTDGEIERNSERAASIRASKARGVSDADAWAETRASKNLGPEALAPIWRDDLAKQGIVYSARHGLTDDGRARDFRSADEALIESLWEKKAYFSLAEIREAVWREAAWDATGRAVLEAEQRVERIASSPALRRADASKYDALVGRSKSDDPVFVPLDLAREEVRLFDDMLAMYNDEPRPYRKVKKIVAAVEKKKTADLRKETGDRKAVFKYRPDQLRAIEHALEGRRLFLISALAGTGKTTSLEAVIDAMEGNGRKVLLAAAWNKAASQISADTGKKRGEEVHTIASLVRQIRAGAVPVDRDTVILVDEAGLASHREIRDLVEICKEFGCSLGLQGDENQTAAVSTGKPFRRLVESGAFAVGTIDEVTRQKDAAQKRATELAARGRFAETLAVYREAGTLHDGFADRDAMVDRLVRDFLECPDDLRQKIGIATRNADVAALNHGVREGLLAAGALDESRQREFRTSSDRVLRLAPGERVCLTGRLVVGRDGRGRGETAGEKSEFGSVVDVSDAGFTVLMDGREKPVFVAASEVPDVAYGYAGTVSKLQGSTVRTAFYLHSEFVNSALAYVALSRHKVACHVYATLDAAKTMASDMARAERKVDARELLSDEDLRLLAEREGVPPDQERAAREARELAKASVAAAGDAERAQIRDLKREKVLDKGVEALERLMSSVRKQVQGIFIPAHAPAPAPPPPCFATDRRLAAEAALSFLTPAGDGPHYLEKRLGRAFIEAARRLAESPDGAPFSPLSASHCTALVSGPYAGGHAVQATCVARDGAGTALLLLGLPDGSPAFVRSDAFASESEAAMKKFVGRNFDLLLRADGTSCVVDAPPAVKAVYSKEPAESLAKLPPWKLAEADVFGRTALHHAALRGDAKAADTLLGLGADPFARDHTTRGTTPDALSRRSGLTLAKPKTKERKEIGSRLGRIPNAGEGRIAGETWDDWETRMREKGVVLAVDLPPPDPDAVRRERLRRAMLEDPSGKMSDGTPFLCHAADIDNAALIAELVETGADVLLSDPGGRIPAHMACSEAALEVLLGGDPRDRDWTDAGAAKAQMSVADSAGRTPLHEAARKGHYEMVFMMLGAGADATRQDGEGMTPLHHAALSGDPLTCRLLDDWDPRQRNVANHENMRPASCTANPEIAELLAPAPVQAKPATPLHQPPPTRPKPPRPDQELSR